MLTDLIIFFGGSVIGALFFWIWSYPRLEDVEKKFDVFREHQEDMRNVIEQQSREIAKYEHWKTQPRHNGRFIKRDTYK